MWWDRILITGDCIKERARRIRVEVNAHLPPSRRANLVFSNVWLPCFQKRKNFKAYGCHGEDGDVSDDVVSQQLSQILYLLLAFHPRDTHNCDEFPLYCNAPQNVTEGLRRLSGGKKRKNHFPCVHKCRRL